MLDPRLLRSYPEGIADRLKKKHFVLDVARLHALETQRKTLQVETETLQNERNTRSKAIGQAKAKGADVGPLLEEVGDLGERLDRAKQALSNVQDALTELQLAIPNLPDDSVPGGDDEADNFELRRWREPTRFNFEAKDHVDLGAGGHLDFEAAARIAGSRFVVIQGDLAGLHRALTQFMLDTHVREYGYEEVYVPYIVNSASLMGTGQLPKFEADQFKLVGDDDYYLAPTAEVPVTNLVRDQILESDELPRRFVCHTPCFRSEAGSYGKDTRGMIRQHQFEKVELVHIVRPQDSWQALDELTDHAESILERLGLPYRAVVLCGGDLGFSAAKTIDLEVWLPGQQRYREISSCSNYLDFQARRLRARYRPSSGGRPELVHTLNGSALASGRTLVAVMENYQDVDGRIHVPEVLQPYLGGQAVIEPVA